MLIAAIIAADARYARRECAMPRRLRCRYDAAMMITMLSSLRAIRRFRR